MTIDSWLQAAIADADRRGLPELKPILETLSRSTTALRAADFNDSAIPRRQLPTTSHQPPSSSHQPPATSHES